MKLGTGAVMCALAPLLALGCAVAEDPAEGALKHRWLFVMRNLSRAETVEDTIALFPRAQAAGYNAVVISDGRLYDLEGAGPAYARNLTRVQAEAKRYGLDLIPAVMPIGYSGGILGHDLNLAEGLPVKDIVFAVRGREAVHLPDASVSLPGGDFERVEGHVFAGWDWQDNAGESIFADEEVFHGGSTSVRMENIPQAEPKWGHCRFSRSVAVKPFRRYHLSVWVKAEEFEAPGTARLAVLAPTEKERSLGSVTVCKSRSQDWTQFHMVFNSLTWDKVRVYFGTWGGKDGRIWWDDVVLEEMGLTNILRRDGCPVSVRGEDGMVYEEGVDYEPIRDPQLSPWRPYHEGPGIRLTADSRIHQGQRLLVSCYHSNLIGDSQVMCCLSEPRVYEILRDQVRRVDDLLHPDAFFMQHDEIRVANWDHACRSRGLTPGELLADNVRRCVEIIKEIRPDAEIWVWSDMFDPHHNAVDEYYLVNGSWEGSWEGLPSDVGVVNWANHLKGKNLKWFADRGHEQVLAGYYDHDEWIIEEWLAAGEGLPGIAGAMYTTWRNSYDDMEQWAAAAWGSGATSK